MILITGANGQLGYDFQRLFDTLKVFVVAFLDKNFSILINKYFFLFENSGDRNEYAWGV